jgi:hypothetical protein
VLANSVNEGLCPAEDGARPALGGDQR